MSSPTILMNAESDREIMLPVGKYWKQNSCFFWNTETPVLRGKMIIYGGPLAVPLFRLGFYHVPGQHDGFKQKKRKLE